MTTEVRPGLPSVPELTVLAAIAAVTSRVKLATNVLVAPLRPAAVLAKTAATIDMMPKPVRAGGVPVWIGGRARPVVARRLARYGAGWIPWGTTPETFGAAVAEMRALVDAEGGDPGAFQIAYPLVNAFRPSGGPDYPAMLADVPRLTAAGVTDFRTLLRVPRQHDAALDMLGELAGHFAAVAKG